MKLRRARLEHALPALAIAGAAVAAWLLGINLVVLLAIAALNLALREEFPFSHFPMYATLSDRPFYLRITDGADRAIRLGSSRLVTKIYTRHRTKAVAEHGLESPYDLTSDQLGAAADAVFDYLEDRSTLPKGPRLGAEVRLYEVRLGLERARVTRTQTLIATRVRR